MIFNKEKILYLAKQKGEFQVKFLEKNKNSDCYKIVKSLENISNIELKRKDKFAWYYSITEKGNDELLKLQAEYKNKNKNSRSKKIEKSLDSFMDDDNKDKKRNYYVYQGRDKKTGEIVYIGTTVQVPNARFRWHKANGKNLNFNVLFEFDNPDDMLQKELDLIKELKPKLNKITNRKQNLNVKLTNERLNKRVGDKEWCQSCLKRRARVGNVCGYC